MERQTTDFLGSQMAHTTEAKVQVDRRRLEAMITGENSGESAEAFFVRVERLTGAKVCWPSRLKIKAKTKKDPLVKLIGPGESVQKAAQMIGDRLRVKKDRVTLKMEVSHCLHSQIIGRGGKNTQEIMRDTGCHIHFPDSNKVLGPTLPQAKNDQVSISGCAKDVERAREMLRAICPLAVSVSIQLSFSRSLCAIQPRLDPVQLQRHFPPVGPGEVSVQFGQSPAPSLLGSLHFVMRSTSRNELRMLRAFGQVCQLIGVFPTGTELFCCSQFEMRPSALPSLGAVHWIAFRTNTQIQLTGQGLLISGSLLEGIFVARKFLIGLLPVSLHFERPPVVAAPSNHMLRAMERELDVQIGERRRKRCPAGGKGREAGGREIMASNAEEERDFVLCTYEANLFNAYLARNRLLQLSGPSSPNPPPASVAVGGNCDGPKQLEEEEDGEEAEQFPRDNESAALMRSICRQSLLADQQPFPLAGGGAGMPPFPSSSNSPPFPRTSATGRDNEAVWNASGIVLSVSNLAKPEGPKSPDPEESPIAAGLLAGAKSVNSQKGEFKRALDRERMLLKANQAIYNQSPLRDQSPEGRLSTPTDQWAGYGFSSSLPAELLRIGRMGSSIWTPAEDLGAINGGSSRRGRPIVGRSNGTEEEEEEEESERPKRVEQEKGTLLAADKVGLQQQENGTTAISTLQPHAAEQLPPVRGQLLAVQEEAAAELPAASGEGSSHNKLLGTGEPRKATALVHPRVAALQAGGQRRPKFTMSTGGLFEGFATADSRTRTTTVPMQGGLLAEETPQMPPANESNATQQTAASKPCCWDIRLLNEPALVLAQLGLAEHIAFFREQEIDMQAFLLLDEPCLKSLGLTTLGARRKVQHAIMKLRDSARQHGLYSL